MARKKLGNIWHWRKVFTTGRYLITCVDQMGEWERTCVGVTDDFGMLVIVDPN